MAYEVNLKEFQGPLDLLLHLIEQAEVDIKDIFISEITAQYLEYMGQIDTLDMDTASEFLTMAATLVYIKSRSLLPKPPKENTEEEDPADALIRQLREYRAAKETGEKLRSLLDGARGIYAKLPEEFALPPQTSHLQPFGRIVFNYALTILAAQHSRLHAGYVHRIFLTVRRSKAYEQYHSQQRPRQPFTHKKTSFAII